MSISSMMTFGRSLVDKTVDVLGGNGTCKDQQHPLKPDQYKVKGAYLHHVARIYNDELCGGYTRFRPPTKQDANIAMVGLACMYRLNSRRDEYSGDGVIQRLAGCGVRQFAMPSDSMGSLIYPAWLPRVFNFIANFKDPLRFPSAGASLIPATSLPLGIPGAALPNYASTEAPLPGQTTDFQKLSTFFDLHSALADKSQYRGRARHILIAVEMLNTDRREAKTLAGLIDPTFNNESENSSTAGINPRYKRIIHQWIARQLYDDSVFNFIIKEMVGGAYNTATCLLEIKTALLSRINLLFEQAPNPLVKQVTEYIMRNVIGLEFPLGLLASLPNDDDDPLQWGVVHAGLAFAARVGFDIRDFTHEEASALGLMIYAQQSEGALPPAYVSLFSLPAMILYQKNTAKETSLWSPATRDAIEVAALLHFSNLRDTFETENDPLGVFNLSLGKYKTRIQINDSHKGLSSGDLDKAFIQQNTHIAEKFHAADKTLITISFSNLPHDEQAFIDSAEITIGKFALVKERDLGRRSHLIPGISHDPDKVTVINSPANVDIFCARQAKGNVRIYALEGTQGHYQIKRVDDIVARYKDLLLEPDRQLYEDDFRLELSYSLNGVVTLAHWGTTRLIDRLAGLHSSAFKRQLEQFGYDTTVLEKTRDILLTLVPFYNCILAAKKGNGDEALLNCSVDVISLLPIIGQVSKVSVVVGKVLVKAGATAGRNAMIKANLAQGARFAVKEAMTTASTDFWRLGIVPATKNLGREQFISLGVAAAHSFDPGVVPVFNVGARAFEHALTLGRRMQGCIPGLKSALLKLENKQSALVRLTHAGEKGPAHARPNLDREQLLAMRTDSADFDFYQRAYAVPLPQNLLFRWSKFSEFMPIYAHSLRPEQVSKDFIDHILKDTFHDKPYIRVKGFKQNAKLNAHPYLLHAQLQTKIGFDYVFKTIETANQALTQIKRDPTKLVQVHHYFQRALGVSDEAITTQAIMHIEGVLQKSMLLKAKIKENIIIASTKRNLGIDNRYASTLTSEELGEGVVAFCGAGDRKNRLIIIADRCFDGTEHARAIQHTLNHEITHLAAATDDIVYIHSAASHSTNEVGMLAIFEQKIAARSLRLDFLKQKIKNYRGLAPDYALDDETIYQALMTDSFFKANAIMLNADHVVKYIKDLAHMQDAFNSAARSRREVNSAGLEKNSIPTTLFKQVIIMSLAN